jgi:hypothetical protein
LVRWVIIGAAPPPRALSPSATFVLGSIRPAVREGGHRLHTVYTVYTVQVAPKKLNT